MTSLPHSPPQKVTRNEPENDNPSSPPPSPKRSFAFTDEADHTPSSLGYFKRRHVYSDGEATKRAPLDPLSSSEIDNRPHKDPRWSEISLHSLATAPELRSCDANPSIPKNETEDETICSRLPAVQSGDADSTVGSSRRERPPLTRGVRYSSDVQESVCASAAELALGWPSPSRSQSDLTSSERRASSRKRNVDKVIQPIRSSAPSMPYDRCPPRDLWKAESASDEPVRTVYGLMDNRDSIFDTPVPPGLTRRRGSVPDITGVRSRSPTSGSLALCANKSYKYERPTGVEQSRVVSMTRRRSKSLPPAQLQPSSSSDTGNSTERHHFRLDSIGTWHGTYLPGDPLTCGVLEEYPSDLPITGGEFYRLLRQAHYNKHASNIFSPLNPLRNPRPSSSLTTNATYRYFFPSIQDIPDNRSKFKRGPEPRLRTICERRQPRAVALECTHCQECQRDTLCKRLLVKDYRRKRRAARKLRTTSNAHTPLSSPPCKIDEDEKSLCNEVTAATSPEPSPGSPRLRDLDDFGNDDGDYPEIPDEVLLSGEEDAKPGTGEFTR
ncbi:hypothetical protein F4604DRAFT_1721588 [Suillus subluteus]|nr:hypothetical protein F4604DRAFT_1721588 [Suillus subluteus]